MWADKACIEKGQIWDKKNFFQQSFGFPQTVLGI
jgi:hypothetical protein